MAPVLILPLTAGAAMVVGNTALYPPVRNNAEGVADAYRFTAGSGGRVDHLNVYLHRTNTAKKVTLGIYSGSWTRARALSAQCTISSPRAGAWNSCSFAAREVDLGVYYWLTVLQPSGTTGRLRYGAGRRSGAPVSYLSKGTRLSSLPSQWRNGAARRAGDSASIYASGGEGVPIGAAAPPQPSRGGEFVPPPAPSKSPPPAPSFPDASNTGVPPGVVLRPSSGIIASTPGAVIDGVDAPWILVEAPNVTIRNSRIGQGIQSNPVSNQSTGLVVEDSEIIGRAGTGIVFDNYTARRVEVTGTENGFQAGDNTTIVDCWVHDLDTSNDAHTDGIQFSPGAGNVLIRHNSISPQSTGIAASTSAIIMHTGSGPQNHDVTIEDNLLDGSHAVVTLYAPREPASNIFIIGNDLISGVNGYTDGVSVPTTVTEFLGNVDYLTRRPVDPE
jgi:hypothetical protein